MRVLLKILELLRPLTESKGWDYCIVWKIGDDPSRCIEWIGCCCSGSQGVCENVKEENDEIELYLPYICRDTYIRHSLRTNACEKLAMIPSSLPLYPGIHGEVAMSKQPFWLSNDFSGTQILVPVDGGLIELFRSKQVPVDPRMIEKLMAQLGIIMDHGLDDQDSKAHLNSYPYHHIVPKLQLLFPNAKGLSPGNGKEILKTKHRAAKNQYQSKNLVTERNRRKRIKDGLYTLRALVPKISKLDKAAIVGDAIEYIKELQKNAKELRDELKELEEEDRRENNGEAAVSKRKRSYKTPPNRVSNAAAKVQMEVHQLGAQDFLLKLICSHKADGFVRIMETVDSLGLQVIDVNVTTCNGQALNILNVEAKGKEVASKNLKDSFLSRWSSTRST